MKASEFSKVVVEMIKSEKEFFEEAIQKEDWSELEDEIFEYVSNCDGD